MGKQQPYKAQTDFSFGMVKTELKPKPEIENQQQALNAMLMAAHTPLCAWVIDNTVDSQPQDGKQAQITVQIFDGQQHIAILICNVPTTANFSKGMFQAFIEQSIVPTTQRTYKQHPYQGSPSFAPPYDASPISHEILPVALEEASRIKPRQLQTH